jgi:hypothetical protein
VTKLVTYVLDVWGSILGNNRSFIFATTADRLVDLIISTGGFYRGKEAGAWSWQAVEVKNLWLYLQFTCHVHSSVFRNGYSFTFTFDVHVDGMRLCLLTTATNGPIIQPPDDI